MVAATFWEVTPLMVILPLRVVPLRVEPLKFDTSMRPLSVVRLAVCAETPSSVMLSLVVLTVMFASVWRGICSVRVQLRVSWLWMTREALLPGLGHGEGAARHREVVELGAFKGVARGVGVIGADVVDVAACRTTAALLSCTTMALMPAGAS